MQALPDQRALPLTGPAPARVRRVVGLAAHPALLALGLTVDLVLWGGDPSTRLGGQVPVTVVPVSALIVFVLLLQRRRRPWLAYAAAWTYTVGWALVLPAYQPMVAMLFAVHALARSESLRRSGFALLGSVVPLAVATSNLVHFSVRPVDVLFSVLLQCVLLGGIWAAGRYGQLAEETAELRVARVSGEAELARVDERLQLARDLHDIASHSVTVIVMQAAAHARSRTELDEESRRAFTTIEASGVQALRELRALLGLVHERAEPSAIGPRLDDIAALLEVDRACGLAVTLTEEGGAVRMDDEAETVAYRVVQEALANALKHGGPQTRAEIRLGWRIDGLDVVVESRQPAGREELPAELSSGLGLKGLRERAAHIGGGVTAGWAAAGVYRVTADVPSRSAGSGTTRPRAQVPRPW